MKFSGVQIFPSVEAVYRAEVLPSLVMMEVGICKLRFLCRISLLNFTALDCREKCVLQFFHCCQNANWVQRRGKMYLCKCRVLITRLVFYARRQVVVVRDEFFVVVMSVVTAASFYVNMSHIWQKPHKDNGQTSEQSLGDFPSIFLTACSSMVLATRNMMVSLIHYSL